MKILSLIGLGLKRAGESESLSGPAELGLGRNAFGSVTLKVSSMVVGLGLSVVLGRALGPTQFGSYVFAFAIIKFLTVLAQAGLPALLVRETAKLEVISAWGHLRGLERFSNELLLVSSAMVVAIAAIVILNPNLPLDHNARSVLLAGLVVVPIMALMNSKSSMVLGFRHVLLGQVPDMLVRPGALVILLVAASSVFPKARLSAQESMFLTAISVSFAAFASFRFLASVTASDVFAAAPKYRTIPWLKSAGPFVLLGGLQILNSQSTKIVLGFLAQPGLVGFFEVASRMALLVAFTMSAVNVVMAPNISRLFNSGEHDKLQEAVTWSARAMLLTALPVALVLLIFGKNLIALLYGTEFAQANKALWILVIGQLASVVAGSVGYLLNMTGHEWDTASAQVGGACAAVGLSIALVPRYGLVGACWASTIATIVVNFALWLQVWRRLKIQSTAVLFRPSVYSG